VAQIKMREFTQKKPISKPTVRTCVEKVFYLVMYFSIFSFLQFGVQGTFMFWYKSICSGTGAFCSDTQGSHSYGPPLVATGKLHLY
jgi:hypothetical protein